MVTVHKGIQPLAAFGEKVMIKYTTGKNRRDKMNTEWDVGYFLGVNVRTAEYLVGKSGGIYSCCTIRRLQDDLAYNQAIAQDIKTTYRDYVLE